jgi:hypothetical protein
MTALRRPLLALAFLALALPAFAQDSRGRVQGLVADSTGGVLPGVTVTLRNDATGLETVRTTGPQGRFVFDQVDPGTYSLTATLQGFGTVMQKEVRCRQRGDLSVNLTMQVSSLTESVQVVAEAPAQVQFNTTNQVTSVDSDLFKQLPISSRNPVTLAALDPSVNGDLTRGANFDHYAANAFDIGGRTAGRNEVLIDGSPLANSSKLGYNPPVDAVAEYTVSQNAVDAEFGHSAGGVITMSMKSGTNKLHGSAYYFSGNPDWNAVTNPITGQKTTTNPWNAGGSAGLPIVKNKLFLFSIFERQNSPSFVTSAYTLPTALERQGDYSQSYNANGSLRVIYDPLTSRVVNNVIVRDPFPGNKIPANRLDPTATLMMANLWNATSAGDDLTGLNNFKFGDTRTYRYMNFSNRLDWNISSAWRTSARVSFFLTDQDATDYTDGMDPLKMRRTEGSQRDGINIAGDSVYTVSSTSVLTLRASYYKTVDRRLYPDMTVPESEYAQLWPNQWYTPNLEGRPVLYFPNFQIPSGDTFGVRNFWYQQPLGYSFGAQYTKMLGNHSLKGGFDTRFKRGDAARYNNAANFTFDYNMTANTASGGSTSTGNPWASFMLGAQNPTGTTSLFVPMQYTNTEMYAAYVQDDFRITQNLTLNLGLRYEYEGGFWDPENRLPQRLDLTDPIPGMQATIDPTLSALPAGATGKTIGQIMAESAGQKTAVYNGAFYFTEPGNNRATKSNALQFMPRLGAAYRVNDRMSVRAGYARFYTPNSATDSGNEPLGSYNLAAFSPITNALPALTGVPQAFLSNPFPQGLTPAYGKAYGRYTNLGDAISIAQYERRPPVSDRINLSVQQELWSRIVLDVSFLTNFISHDLLTINKNLADPRLSYTYKAELSKTVPNPFYNYGAVSTFPGALRSQATVSVASLLRPYPQYGDLNQTFTDLGKYRNNTFMVRLQRPFVKGFSFLASYAYVDAKSQTFYDNQDQYDGILTWVPDTNSRHRVVGTGVWEFPIGRGRAVGGSMSPALDAVVGGWQIAGTYTYRSGNLLSFGAMLAPESVQVLGGTGKNAYWFDKTGFAALPAFTRRTNPITYENLRGPSYKNLDLSLAKSVSLGKGQRFQFRLEAYNALNVINWADPVVTITSSDFGKTNAQRAGTAGRTVVYNLRWEF